MKTEQDFTLKSKALWQVSKWTLSEDCHLLLPRSRMNSQAQAVINCHHPLVHCFFFFFLGLSLCCRCTLDKRWRASKKHLNVRPPSCMSFLHDPDRLFFLHALHIILQRGHTSQSTLWHTVTLYHPTLPPLPLKSPQPKTTSYWYSQPKLTQTSDHWLIRKSPPTPPHPQILVFSSFEVVQP